MTRRSMVRRREMEHGRNARVAAIVALVMLIAGFLFIRMPEAKPFCLVAGDSTIVIPIDKDKLVTIPVAPKPRVRPMLPVPDPEGKETDPSVGKHDWDPFGTDVAAPPALEPVEFWKVEVKPKVVHVEDPVYPELALAAGIEGRVVVKVLIDTSGLVLETKLFAGSGNRSLDQAAMNAALKFRFTSAYQRDRPVRVWMAVPFRFRLD